LLKVQSAPLQAKQFHATKARVQGEYYPRFVLRWKNIEQADLLFISKPTHPTVVLFLQPNFLDWIPLYFAVLYN
jgi:hypothetical protein